MIECQDVKMSRCQNRFWMSFSATI